MVKQKMNPPVSHVNRPAARTLLPFRVLEPANILILEYDVPAMNGQPAPCRVYDPCAAVILRLMEMYWDLEGQVDSLNKKNDEYLVNGKLLEARCEELERRNRQREK